MACSVSLSKRFKERLCRNWALCAFAFLFCFPAFESAKAAELVMFEALGCEYCQLWDEEIGAGYEQTAAGKAAPLRRVLMDIKRPNDLRGIEGIRYSPTFVVLDKGREFGRITGYPGEAFFWGYLEEILKNLASATKSTSAKTH
jgi:hypothetical protein